jgi:aspartate carbamoyltransferase
VVPYQKDMTTFKDKDILSTKDLSLGEIEKIMETAGNFYPVAKKEKQSDLLKGFLLASLFYEPSTRTRLSFETAMQRLGGRVISVSGMEGSSLAKGETLLDTGRVVSRFADVIAIRHPQPGSADEFAIGADIPVINAGDGAGEHPTQALLDLYTIKRERNKIDGLTVAMVGDLKFGRTVHSLSYLLSHFGINLILVSPDQLRMPKSVISHLKEKKIEYKETEQLNEALKHADVIYMTRVQKERFADPAEYERFRGYYILTKEQVEKYNRKMLILHPLPRVGEISLDVDELPGAAYFRQVENGVAVRMALLSLVLGKV